MMRGEPAVEQHQLGNRPGRWRARAHGDADVGELEGQDVVDAVAGHRPERAGTPVGGPPRDASALRREEISNVLAPAAEVPAEQHRTASCVTAWAAAVGTGRRALTAGIAG